MNQIVNTLISALGIARRDRAANDLHVRHTLSMVELDAKDLAHVVGGDTDGPRGGWINAASATA